MRTLVIVSFVLFFLSVTIPFTSLAAPQPPCAPLTPPDVPGPLSDPPSSPGNLFFINEVLFTPNRTWICPSPDQPPPDQSKSLTENAWVEIYNSQDVAIDLYSNVHATLDSGPGTPIFYFPKGSVIAPHSFLVVFPRTSTPSFSQSTQLRLLISGITPLDTVDNLPLSMPPDTSYARVTDGGSQWQWLTNPTPGTSNPAALQTSISSTTTLIRTPTPKASPTPHRTPTPHTAKSSRSSGGGLQDGSTGDNGQADQGSDSSVLVDGVQPAWNKLPVPGSPTSSPTATSDTSDVTTNEPLTTPDNSGDHTIRNIEMTVIAILLVGSLFWCWKLFIAPRLARQKP